LGSCTWIYRCNACHPIAAAIAGGLVGAGLSATVWGAFKVIKWGLSWLTKTIRFETHRNKAQTNEYQTLQSALDYYATRPENFIKYFSI